MKQIFGILVCCIVVSHTCVAQEDQYDLFLQRIIRTFDVRPLPTKPFELTEKYKLGRALFFDPILSGNRDVACATCHLLAYGTSDGLALAIGTGGIGLGPVRTLPAARAQQPRNALDLWNRDNNWVKSMFWDGRVEVLDPVQKTFRSPLGTRLPRGFDNVMAVQALFPLTREDEMLGALGDRSPSHLPTPHADRENDLASDTAHLRGEARIERVLNLIVERLLGRKDGAAQPWQVKYRALFRAAYPNIDVGDLSFVHAGNALSHFEEIAFATRQTPWDAYDAYVSGDRSAISQNAKRGAILFFGKGRCAVCHRGPLFSDFEFHSIGVRNSGPGFDANGTDLGRYLATGRLEDKYKFRTPPLRNVTLTAPYFHNGSAATLDDAIAQHLDPLYYADKYEESGAYVMKPEQIEAVSPILTSRVRLSGDEIVAIEAFFKALEDRGPTNIERIVPTTVPSGLPVSIHNTASGKTR